MTPGGDPLHLRESTTVAITLTDCRSLFLSAIPVLIVDHCRTRACRRYRETHSTPHADRFPKAFHSFSNSRNSVMPLGITGRFVSLLTIGPCLHMIGIWSAFNRH